MFCITKSLKKINQDDLGAIDNTTGYFCKFDENLFVNDILNGKVKNWSWSTISTIEIEEYEEACVMFVDHIDEDPLSNMNFLPSFRLNRRVEVGIYGILINQLLFVRDKFKVKKSFTGFTTQESLHKNRGVAINSYCLHGVFNLTLCSYYCDFN